MYENQKAGAACESNGGGVGMWRRYGFTSGRHTVCRLYRMPDWLCVRAYVVVHRHRPACLLINLLNTQGNGGGGRWGRGPDARLT